MEWVGCIRCEKFENDFMAQTCALIAPVQPVLQRVSCSNETLPNATKHYETHQNMSLGSNGVDRFRSLRKIPMGLRGTNFSLVAPVQPVLYRASCSNKIIQNASKHCIRCEKFQNDFMAQTCALIAPVQLVLQRV